jgi:3-deoxy-D-manno-octulosonate 8-phosphate phosphatase (KDO 8-P phosphatase)
MLPSASTPAEATDALPYLPPVQHFDPVVLLRAQAVKVVFFDIDGVMTDGSLFYTEAGETLKRFHVFDGYGIKLLKQAGITPAVVSGGDIPTLRKRLDVLGIRHIRLGTEDKRPAVQALLDELGLGWHQAAAMGDDWPDAPVLRRVALACAPQTAHPEILRLAHFVPSRPAGNGAIRELCDLLLAASGVYAAMWQAASA